MTNKNSSPRIEELMEALDGYDALDEVQRDIIRRWADGEDVNDVRKFDAS